MARTNFNRLLAEVATFDSDLQNPALSGIYYNPDRTIQYAIEVELDTHATSVLEERKLAVTSYAWNVTPGDDSAAAKAAADLVKRVIDSIGMDKLTLDLLDAILKGIAVVELMYEVKGNEILVTGFIPRPTRRFQFDKNLQLRLLTQKSPMEGELVPPRKFLVHTVGGRDGNPYGFGLCSKLLGWVRYKREINRLWAEYNERTSKGTWVLKLTGNCSPAELQTAQQVVDDAAQSGTVVLTENMDLKLIEPSGNSSESFMEQLKFANDEISKCSLGKTKSDIASQGKAGLSTAHTGAHLERVRADADALSVTLGQQLARWLTELNFGPDVAPPQVYRQVGDNEAFMEQVKRDHLVAALGYKPSPDHVRESYGGDWQENTDNQKTPPSIAGIIG